MNQEKLELGTLKFWKVLMGKLCLNTLLEEVHIFDIHIAVLASTIAGYPQMILNKKLQ